MATAHKKCTILICDDTPDVLTLFSFVLQEEGYEVFQAIDGNQCLQIARERRPDLILLDVMLPDIDGIEVCRRIKSDRELARTLVIHLSGIQTSTDHQAEGLEAGADGYLTMPVPPRNLVAHIKALLRIKDAEEALRESEERWRLTIENMKDFAIFMLDSDGRIASWNRGAERILGYQETEIVGQPASTLFTPEDVERGVIEEELRQAAAVGRASDDRWLVRKDGTRFWAAGILTTLDNGVRRFVKILRDNTERKLAEEKTKSLLKEKHGLLQEIHHRVKNNLQVISSLLNLQSGYVQEQSAREMLKESQNRIRTMALVHEQLYRSSNLSRIDFGDYLRQLTVELFRLYGVDSRLIKAHLNVQDVSLGIDEAIPCGLIVNELVSNSLKHAFPDAQEGEIRISLVPKENNKLLLEVADNGVGLPPGFDIRHVGSLGMQLITTLVAQLDGTLEQSNTEGTKIQITFAHHRNKE